MSRRKRNATDMGWRPLDNPKRHLSKVIALKHV